MAMLQNDPDIHFDADAHIYTHIPSGLILPSVTQVMRFMSRELYDLVPFNTLDEAADRGTRVHEQTANYDLYGFIETDDDTGKYIDGYMQFLSDYKPTWTAIEWISYHKGLRYAGTCDRLGYVLPDDGTGVDLVDLKTTRTFHNAMLSTQLGGYGEIVKSHGIKLRKRYGLQLLPDGTYRFQEVDDGFRSFLYCLGLHNTMASEVRR